MLGPDDEMVWRHSQWLLNKTGKCPLPVLGRPTADELTEFFEEDE